MTSKEALEVLNNPTKKEHWDLQNKAYEVLEQLVERDTPKKVCYDNVGRSECPSCDMGYLYNGGMNKNKYCGYCGQKLCWWIKVMF